MLEKLKNVIARINPDIDLAGVEETTRLADDLGLDSLSVMLFAMEIEAEFGFRFSEPVRFETVKDVCTYLEEHCS